MRLKNRAGWSLVVAVLLLSVGVPIWAKPQNLIKFFFLNTGVQPQAQGKILFVSNPAQSFFTILVSHLTPGTYDVGLNGAVVDSITVNTKGVGTVSHGTGKNNATSLPYDPRGGELTIQATGTELLDARIPSTAAAAQQKTEIDIDLSNMGIDPGSAEAVFRSRFGRMQFEVDLHGSAPGTYDLTVGGTKVGQIVVDLQGKGRIEFDSMPSSDDNDEGLALRLTFDPRGQEIQVMQNGMADFQAMFPQTP